MLLLNEVMHRSVDPGYAETAARRSAGTLPRLTRGGVARLLIVAILLGFATTAAALVLRAPKPEVVAARQVLEQEIRERRENVELMTEEIEVLNVEIGKTQADTLSDAYPKLLAVLEVDATSSGALGVQGPGLSVTMRDAPTVGDGQDANSRVQDYDVQVVVNSLWAAGAEAVAVNEQRLTATSAIRSAGDAILVDLVGLVGPYEIQAVGSPADLSTYFSRSIGQQHLSILSSRYGITSSIEEREDLELRPGPSRRLFYAVTPEDLELLTTPEQETISPTNSAPGMTSDSDTGLNTIPEKEIPR